MYYVPRGGNRGGADNFKWEDVKEDKGRECYLGHSLMAPVGRWQKNKDLQWFSKDRPKDAGAVSFSEEAEAARNAEREALLIALGQKVGDKLAAEAMQPQKELDHRKIRRQQILKKKKGKVKKKKKVKDLHSKSKRKHKHSKKKRRKQETSSEESESSSSSDSDSSSPSDSDEDYDRHKRRRKDASNHGKRDDRNRYRSHREKHSREDRSPSREDYRSRERRDDDRRDNSKRKYDEQKKGRRK